MPPGDETPSELCIAHFQGRARGELWLTRTEAELLDAAFKAAATSPGVPHCQLISSPGFAVGGGVCPCVRTSISSSSRTRQSCGATSQRRRDVLSQVYVIDDDDDDERDKALVHPDPPLRRSPRILARYSAGEQTLVLEATSVALRTAALDIFFSKPTFQQEQDLVRRRVVEQARDCITYVLTWGAGQGEACRGRCVSAMTVRVNSYRSRRGSRWAQILNIGADPERHGHGRRLMTEVERLLAVRDDVGVVVCYPADRSAELFWEACGFTPAQKDSSLLPQEDQLPREGGQLIPEFSGRDGSVLTRWEREVGCCIGVPRSKAKRICARSCAEAGGGDAG